MVSAGIQRTELSNWHLAKTFYFKAKSKDLADLVKNSKLRINYSHC